MVKGHAPASLSIHVSPKGKSDETARHSISIQGAFIDGLRSLLGSLPGSLRTDFARLGGSEFGSR
jgi:hypothetical protein